MTSRRTMFHLLNDDIADMDMKTQVKIFMAAFALVMAACSPTIYGIQVDTRQPSASGLDLTGKSVAIVYPGGLGEKEDALIRSFAESLSKQLDASYPESDSVIVYTLPYTTDYLKITQPDSLVNLVMDSNCDVLFLFGRAPAFAVDGSRETDFRMPVTIYDAMAGGNDAMRTFNIVGNAGPEPDKSGDYIGRKVSESFVPQWKTEMVDIYALDNEDWIGALYDAADCRWANAVEKWTSILSSENDLLKRACLEYNLAVGCMLLGRPDLAQDWVELSLRENPTDEAKALSAKLKTILKSKE